MVSRTSKANNTMHTSGIYSDMSIDGPEIGTLVVVVDRAKNLPNRRTMGKQDPYCACRLGKEAKKTNTDKRGGQVPRWDQELRFTVHDSPDYYQIKVSVFNDDKKTELIGENWVNLSEVIVPGGGQSDVWHNLNSKGRYAGEIRLELTYYDTRPKPEETVAESMSMRTSSRMDMEDGTSPGLNGPRSTPVKRRPLPSNPGSAAGSPAEHGRALPPTTGPRGYGTPPRQLPQTRPAGGTPSSQRRSVYNNNQPQPSDWRRPAPSEHVYPETPDDPFVQQPSYQEDPYQQYSNYEPSEASYSQHSYSHQAYEPAPLGLPELPPLNNGRRPVSNRPSYSSSTQLEQDAYHPPELIHSQSAPVVPAQQYYADETQEQRLPLHHAQSDSFVHQPQPLRVSRSGTMEPIYDNHPEPPQDYRQPSRHNSEDYSLSMAQSHPPYHGYDDVGPRDEYNPNQQWALPPPVEEEAPPPPPPAHRDSAPSSAQRQVQPLPRDYQPDYAPAPLNIGSARESTSRSLPYEESQEYHHQQYVELDFGGPSRRYTEPIDSSPHQEQAIHRPRASSGDAMRKSPTRDDELFLPENGGYGAASGSPAQPYHQEHRNSLPRQHDHSPAAHSPLALESPRSFRESGSGSHSQSHSQPHTPSLVVRYNQKQISPTKRQTPQRPLSIQHHSGGESYHTPTTYQTPPRPHPLAQEVPVAGRSPQQYGTPPQDQSQLINSDPRRPRDLQRNSIASATKRKSVSPRPPSSAEARTSIPFGPDSFDQFNPTAGRSTSSLLNHPATSGPCTPLDNSKPSSQRVSPFDSGEAGKIVDFHGNEIDPSDRLPETSWAPEPEPKGKDKLKEEKYRRDRDRLTGARGPGSSAGGSGSRAGASPGRLSMYGGSASASPLAGGSVSNHSTPLDSPLTGAGTVARNRLQKRGAGARPVSMVSLPSSQSQPFRDIPNPPEATSPGGYGNYSPHGYGSGGSGDSPGYAARGSYTGVNAPPIPAKVPLGDGFANEDLQALSAEINRIDLGPASGSGRGRVGKGRMIGYR